MVTGKRPYPEDSASLLMKMHCTRDIPDPGERVSNLPDALRSFILKACRRDPAARYRNVPQAMEELRPLARTFASSLPNPETAKENRATLLLSYEDQHREVLNRLLEEFTLKVNKLGASLKTYYTSNEE